MIFLGIKYDDLDLERKYLEKELMQIDDTELKTCLEARLEKVKAEIVLRAKSATAETTNDKFIGLFSYSLAVSLIKNGQVNISSIIQPTKDFSEQRVLQKQLVHRLAIDLCLLFFR
jgi:hypothetical protein